LRGSEPGRHDEPQKANNLQLRIRVASRMDEDFAAAKALHAEGDLEAAAAAYSRVSASSPDYAKSRNNLGTVLEALQRPAEAIAAYQDAVARMPDAWLPHYNIGHLLYGQARWAVAAAAFRRALEREPRAVQAAYNLGCALGENGEGDAAIAAYRQALAIDAGCVEAWSNLGAELYRGRCIDEARDACEHAVKLRPELAEEHYRLGRIYAVLRRYDDAVAAYRRSLALNPRSRTARESLARTLAESGCLQEAAAVYREWLVAAPGDPTPEHMLQALAQSDSATASADYVRTTFDAFAADFDTTLELLGYRGPVVLAQTLAAFYGAEPQACLRVLELGCGTGLCAGALRPRASRLVGLDLSPQMLEQAARRAQYDELHEGELIAFLAALDADYDLIVAVDTFIYLGTLETALAGVCQALAPGGKAVFTLEAAEDSARYRLQMSGRFQHSANYLRSALSASGLGLRSLEESALRREGGAEVRCWLVVAERPQT
jgi:predicted TPR repeat methyltransferase